VNAVSFEIDRALPDVKRVYTRHECEPKYEPLRDTISPKTRV
jgi:hypothetical protein